MTKLKGYAFGKIMPEEVEKFKELTGGCNVGDFWILISEEEANKNWEEMRNIVFKI